jgi:hypothetical protein
MGKTKIGGTRSSVARIAMTSLKFVFFAVPGGFLFVGGLLIATGELFFELHHPHPNTFKDIAAGTIAAIIGFPTLMYGLDRWGQWRYALVFISLPLSVWAVSLVTSDKGGVLLAVIPTLIVYRFVKNSYEKAV